jgi:hypothetical protein
MQPSRPGKQRTVGGQQHCVLGQCRGNDDAVERIAVQIIELHRCHCDLGRQAYLTHAQRQDAMAPRPNVRRPLDTPAPEPPTYFEDDDRRDGELTRGERGVATSSCRPSELWHLLGHPYERVRIEQEGHRIAQ